MEINITYKELKDSNPEFDTSMINFLNESSSIFEEIQERPTRVHYYLKPHRKFFVISDTDLINVCENEREVNDLVHEIQDAIVLLKNTNIISVNYKGIIKGIDNSQDKIRLHTKDGIIIVRLTEIRY